MADFLKIVNFIRDLYKTPKDFISLHTPVFNGNENKYLKECIDSTYVSSVGKFVDMFEAEMANYTGAKKAVACVNGTSALHLALKLVGVKTGHEVLTQPLTFIATANAITYCGAQPVFIDVDIDTMGLSPTNLENWLKHNVIFKNSGNLSYQPFDKTSGNQISACLPMHTFGHPCRIDEIVDICTRFNIPVIEDAAESMGSFYRDKHTGIFGKIGVLSFNGNKIVTTGGGGMLLFEDEILAKRAKFLSTQAKVPHPWEYAHNEIGFNYRLPNINAALGLAQLEQLDHFLASKKDLSKQYENFFKSLDVKFVREPRNASSNYWLNCIILNNREERDAFLSFSNENGIMTRPAWQLLNKLPMFKDCQTSDLYNSEWLENRIVNIPSSVIN